MPSRAPSSPPVTEQPIAVGPVASQVAIKQLGTNGGGYYNVNSAHPLENPTPLSNFVEDIAILLISGALCFTFGRMVGSRKQGIALADHDGDPAGAVRRADRAAGAAAATRRSRRCRSTQQPSALQPGGNMEGKEARFGISASALWATTTTAASNGSVNSMHDSYSPLGGLSPIFLMALGEVSFGGVGSGLYGLLIFAIVGVFIAGLMVGRTPEFLGKKIEAYEMKMASFAILVPVAAVLLGTAFACLADETYTKALANHGPHGFSEVLYAFTSQGNNNGSAFAGLTASGTFFATAGGHLHVGRALLDHHPDARDRRIAGQEEDRAAIVGHIADARPAVRGPAGRRGAARRCPVVRPRPGARPDRRAPRAPSVNRS